MQVVRQFIEVKQRQVVIELPESFINHRVEVIALTVDEDEQKTDDTTKPDVNTAPITTPRLEDNSVPPPRTEPGESKPNVETPKETKPAPAGTPAPSRPREVEPAKKKGKKGDDGPPN